MRTRRLGILPLLVLSASSLVAQAPPAQRSALANRVNEYRAARQPEIIRELGELVAIPNVATDSADIERNLRHLVEMLARRDIPARVLRREGSHPAVYGELRVPGATRTVMMYAHFDGQPVKLADWASPPFQPTILTGPRDAGGVPGTVRAGTDVGEWRLYGRSASDDKGPIVAMLTALDALRALGERPSVNLKFFFEGGEEAGSAGLGELMRANAELLRADLWLLCDGPVHALRRPQVVFGVRGVMGLELTVFGAARALHSGHYGNWAPNPASELAELISGMRDSEGRIRIDGFYDDVRPLTPSERSAVAILPPADAALRQSLLLGRTEGAASVGESIMQPAFNIRGLQSGSVDDAPNAVPTTARASIDLRLVPDQTPDGVKARIERHLRGLGYHLVFAPPTAAERLEHPRLVQVGWSAGPYAGYRVDAGSPFARALERIVASAVSAPVLVPMLGGSLPVSVMVEAVGTPMVILPIVNHDNNQHASDENLRLQNLWDGITLFASVMVELDREWRRSVGATRQGPEWTLLIRNGTIIDGTGAPGYRGDVAVSGDRISAVSRTPLDRSRAVRVIDATGLVIAPGFIDLHAHIDPLLRLPDAKSHVTQGVTLALGGPDGGSPWPLASYMDSAQKSGLGMNVAYLVGHNTIRREVMGTENRAPTAVELDRMIALVRQGMGEGAFGISTGLRYVPGYYSKTDEVVALSRAAADSGGFYTSHLREEGLGLFEGVAEAITIARDARIPVVLTHHKAVGQPMWGKSVETLRMVNEARVAGLDVMIDQYPYTATSTSLSVLIPPWALAGGTPALRERLAQPVLRDSIERGVVEYLRTDRGGGDTRRVQFGRVAWDKSLEGRTLFDWAERRGVGESLEAAARLVLEGELNGGASMIYHVIDEGDVRRIMAHPQTMIASDGRLTQPGEGVPHPRAYGTFPRVLGTYVRELKVLTLELAVHKMTGMPAARMGLQGQRGCLAAGCAADITLFDAERVGSPATFTDPHHYAIGIPFVIVNGTPVVDGGMFTSQRPGRVLRRPVPRTRLAPARP